ncbi:MBL fold metallo-hydrolase [Actinacidiphila yeochonensis]|uniref:MBL fold metallo-hydrolase n=1 Tax=Actinacidiphila yeochonensis TaxID=89050 RepID=UPI0007C83ACB|nr:MBL fold metallo-hydrolase [Actinacidiphila yeochonensis]
MTTHGTARSTGDEGQQGPVAGSMEVEWAHGARFRWSAAGPAIQVHHYDGATVILRQSKELNYEAPFLYLLFGRERALLLDTGATSDPALFPLRRTVDALVDAWLAAHPECAGGTYGLVVAHSHAHGDHVAADGQFADRPHTTVVAHEAAAVREFFGFGSSWPEAEVPFDLGGRVLDVIGSPGHQEAAVTFYDRRTGVLLTGDTVLPGRLYAFDGPAYLATLDRLVAFAAEHPVTHVLGGHVEMGRRPGHEYPIGASYQPREQRLELTAADLSALRDAAVAVAGQPGVHRLPGAVLYLQPSPSDMRRLVLRGRTRKALRTLIRN